MFEVKDARLAPFSDLYVAGFVRTHRITGIRSIRNAEEQISQFLLDSFHFFIESGDFVRELFHLSHQLCGIFTGFFQFRNLSGISVLSRFQSLYLSQKLSSPVIELDGVADVVVAVASRFDRFFYIVKILADPFDI